MNKQTQNNLKGPGPGRPKGSKNKTTALLKDALLLAAIDAGGGSEDGLVKYLTDQALKNPAAFMTLLGKVLPLQVGGIDDSDGSPSEIAIRIVSPTH